MRMWPKNRIYSSLLAAALSAFILGQRGLGFMVFVFALLIWTRTHGHCPATLEETGISREDLKDKLGFAAYFFDQGKPNFFYHATFTPYAVCSCDFKAGAWRCRPD